MEVKPVTATAVVACTSHFCNARNCGMISAGEWDNDRKSVSISISETIHDMVHLLNLSTTDGDLLNENFT